MGPTDRDRATKTLQPLQPPVSHAEHGDSYLLLFEGSASHLFRLPLNGEVIIGRAQDADIRLNDPTASRKHACLSIQDGEIRIRDLESHNGTRVNDEQVALPRILISGDTIAICNATLVLQRQRLARRSRVAAEFSQFRQRLEEEIERAERYQRLLTLVVFELSDPSLDRGRALAVLMDDLRLIDLPAWEGASRLLLLMPEIPQSAVQETVERLLIRLLPLAPSGRAGFAIFLSDGTDGDTLIAGARAAAIAATPGSVLGARDLKSVRKLGEDSLFIADPAMFSVYELVEQLAKSDIPVLIHGETGTGKDLVARALHYWSPRSSLPLVTLNSATVQDSLAESQLFGHVKGAFSGATSAQAGILESAGSGTVFLDEIGEISLAVQAKLLRAIEARKLRPVGSNVERPFDARLVVATNRDLEREVQAGRFRQDLYYRLNVGIVELPPLRRRKRELLILARAFLQAACRRLGRTDPGLTDPVMERLQEYAWPGNVRELKNVMEFLASTVTEPAAELWHLPPSLRDFQSIPPEADEPSEVVTKSDSVTTLPRRPRSLPDEMRVLEIQRIQQELKETNGSVSQAAVRLNMPIRTVYHKIKLYGLKPAEFKKDRSE